MRHTSASQRMASLGWGLAVALPVLPAGLAYLASEHLGYTTHGAGKLLLVLGVAAQGWHMRWLPRYRTPGLWLGLALVLGSAWSQAAGFSVWGLFLGLCGLLAWRHACHPDAQAGQSLAAALVWSVMLLPLLDVGLVSTLREVSLQLVDQVLGVAGVQFRRVGISYFVGAEQFPVWQRCSGSSTSRVFLILLAGGYIVRGCHGKVWLRAPILATIMGLHCNVWRIAGHIGLSAWSGHSLGPSFHNALGMFLFGLHLPLLAALILRSPRRTVIPAAKLPERLASWKVASAGLLLAVANLALWSSGAWWPGHKQMDHQYQVWTNWRLERVHANRFVEYWGGGGWILLEHPIEACLTLRGWDMDGARTHFNRSGQTLRLESRFWIGDEEFGSRWWALANKWARPGLWHVPLRVRLDLIEPSSARTWEPSRKSLMASRG